MRLINGLIQNRWTFGATFAKRHPISMCKKVLTEVDEIEYAIHENSNDLKAPYVKCNNSFYSSLSLLHYPVIAIDFYVLNPSILLS